MVKPSVMASVTTPKWSETMRPERSERLGMVYSGPGWGSSRKTVNKEREIRMSVSRAEGGDSNQTLIIIYRTWANQARNGSSAFFGPGFADIDFFPSRAFTSTAQTSNIFNHLIHLAKQEQVPVCRIWQTFSTVVQLLNVIKWATQPTNTGR